MNTSDEHLNNIFQLAKVQTPIATFAEVQNQFTEALLAGAGTAAGAVASGKSGLLGLGPAILVPVAVVFSGLMFFMYGPNSFNSPEPNFIEPMVADTLAEEEEPALVPFNLDTIIYEEDPLEPELNDIEVEQVQPFIEQKEEEFHEAPLHIPKSMDDSLFGKAISRKRTVLISVQTDSLENVINDNSVVAFLITELTKKSELEYIAQMARAAGIDYDYKADYKKKRRPKRYYIREIRITMNIEGDCQCVTEEIYAKVGKEGKFTVNIGWTVDENGRAIQFNKRVDTSSETLIEQ